MAVKLNLIPQDYIVSGSVSKILKISRPLNVILLGAFIVTALGMGIFFIFSSRTLKSLSEANALLSNKIKSQTQAQQQLVLLKDRLGKIKALLSQKGAYTNIKLVDPMLDKFSDKSSIKEFEVDTQKSVLSIDFTNNTDLTTFIKNLNSQTAFSGIVVDAFNYDPVNGYIASFSLTGKE